MLLIGLDAAAQFEKFGYAIGRLAQKKIKLIDAGVLKNAGGVEAKLAGPIRNAGISLIAIDAPLGWPAQLARNLSEHVAGNPLYDSANRLFRRRTDDAVNDLLGKRPLDIGADKIARAAWRALDVLRSLRGLLACAIPMAWSPERLSGVSAIEVYPAGTLAARGLPCDQYKKKEQKSRRDHIASMLRHEIPDLGKLACGSTDIFDAGLCLVAALDFLNGLAILPTDLESAKREGWIWVRNPGPERRQDNVAV